jgi:hypothetical protein
MPNFNNTLVVIRTSKSEKKVRLVHDMNAKIDGKKVLYAVPFSSDLLEEFVEHQQIARERAERWCCENDFTIVS